MAEDSRCAVRVSFIAYRGMSFKRLRLLILTVFMAVGIFSAKI